MLTTLERDKSLGKGAVPWTACKPFVENSRAVLVHRPRRVTTRKIGPKWAPHISIGMWCGNSMSGSKKFTFLDAPGDGRIVCARCEEKAIANGLPTSSAIAGRHVHTGGVVAVMHCCQPPQEPRPTNVTALKGDAS